MPNFQESELSSDFVLNNIMTTWTDTGLEKASIELSEGDHVRVECRGQIWNGSSDDFNIKARVLVGSTVCSEWEEDDPTASLHRKPFYTGRSFTVGNGASDLLTPGTYTFKLQAQNAQGSSVNFIGGSSQAFRLEIEVYP